MTREQLHDILERSPVIASFHDNEFEKTLTSPPEILFDLKASLPKEAATIPFPKELTTPPVIKIYFVIVELLDILTPSP